MNLADCIGHNVVYTVKGGPLTRGHVVEMINAAPGALVDLDGEIAYASDVSVVADLGTPAEASGKSCTYEDMVAAVKDLAAAIRETNPNADEPELTITAGAAPQVQQQQQQAAPVNDAIAAAAAN